MYTSTPYLIRLIEHRKGSLVLRFGGELKILNVLGDNFSVCNEETLEKQDGEVNSENTSHIIMSASCHI